MSNLEHITILYEATLKVIWNFLPVFVFLVVGLPILGCVEKKQKELEADQANQVL